MQAVLDPNVIISGAWSAGGAPADLLRALERGEFDLIASQELFDELARALAYPKLRARVRADDAAAVLQWVRDTATVVPVGEDAPPIRSADPGDDYLILLASTHRAALVSGDPHLLALADRIPVLSPRDFLALLAGT